MVSLFVKFLKVLPWLGVALVVAAVGLSLAGGQMGPGALTLIGVGFLLVLSMFLKIEAGSLRFYLNLAAVGGLLLANMVLFYQIAGNRGMRWDLTRRGRYSLYPETQRILKNLSAPVEIEVLAISNEPWRSYFSLYTQLSEKVSLKITNPYATGSKPDQARSDTKLNDVLVRSGDRETRIRFDAEADIERIGHKIESQVASAILRVIQARDIRVYFVSRHGERSPDFRGGDQAKSRMVNQFAEFLSKRAIAVRVLDLQTERLVPDDCNLLAIVGPMVDYMPDEIDAIRTYLERGGALLAMIDPPADERSRLPRLRNLLLEYGIAVQEEVAVDNESFSSRHNQLVPLIHDFNPIHPITENLEGTGEDMPLTVACPVEKMEDARKDLKYAALIQTSAKSAVIGLEQYARMAVDKKLALPPSSQWRKYPLALAVDAKPTAPGLKRPARRLPRIVVFGDADFLTDAQLGPTQTALGYFTVNWLVGETDLVDIPAPPTDITPIVLGANQRNLVSILTVVALPFTVFFGGLAYTTIRRRQR